jgi:hypothetical protein
MPEQYNVVAKHTYLRYTPHAGAAAAVPAAAVCTTAAAAVCTTAAAAAAPITTAAASNALLMRLLPQRFGIQAYCRVQVREPLGKHKTLVL